MILVGMLGAVIGITSFAFLHSRTKSDFYFSLPAKRSEMYKVILISSLIIFMVPTAAGLVIETIICAAITPIPPSCFTVSLVPRALSAPSTSAALPESSNLP
jgi:hypothetical protein